MLRSGYFVALVVLFATLIGANGCHKAKQANGDNRFFNDFDQMVDWGCANATLVKGNSHSGRYHVQTDPQSRYGQGLTLMMMDFALIRPTKIKVEAWVKANKAAPVGSVVATFDIGPKIMAWYGIDLSKKITEPEKWIFVSDEFIFPQNLPAETQFRYYLWNNGDATIHIDDMSIEFTR